MSISDQHSQAFREQLTKYSDHGLSLGVCTGTSAWNSLAGSPEAAMAANAAAHRALDETCGRSHGVSIVAHWCSDPALTHTVFSWPGIVYSAGLAWNTSAYKVIA